MNPTGRDSSVAPDSIVALSCCAVTDKSWLFAGMTGLLPTGIEEQVLVAVKFKQVLIVLHIHSFWILSVDSDQMTKMHEAIEIYLCELNGHTLFVSPDNFSLHLNPQQTGTPNEIYLQYA